MARGGHGGGSRNPANQTREVQVSRKVSWLLRHGANSEGLKLGKGGYVGVQDAVSLRNLTHDCNDLLRNPKNCDIFVTFFRLLKCMWRVLTSC
jgi:hypothetical protein